MKIQNEINIKSKVSVYLCVGSLVQMLTIHINLMSGLSEFWSQIPQLDAFTQSDSLKILWKKLSV